MTNLKKIVADLQSALSGQSPLSIDLYVEVLADFEDELKASLDKDADDALLCMLADDGDVAMMVTACCYGRRTRTYPRRKGSFLAIFQYGGRERAIPPATGPETGLPPEVTGYQPPTMQISATGANRKPCKPCFLVGR